MWMEPLDRQTEFSAISLTLAGLRIFEAVARNHSFSRAAEELGVSQPYVSNQVADIDIEIKLRITLFRRIGRRVSMTDAGELPYEKASPCSTRSPMPREPCMNCARSSWVASNLPP